MSFDRTSARGLVLVVLTILALGAVAGCGGDDSDKSVDPNAATDPGSTESTNVATGSTGDSKVELKDPNDENNDSNGVSQEPPPVQILTGNNTGVKVNVPTAIVAQSQAQRNAMLKRHFAKGIDGDIKTVTGSNFKDRQVVGLFYPKSPAGTLVTVIDVHEEDGRVVVNAVKLLNGKGCGSSGKRQRPFHIVETRKMELSGKPVVNVEAQRASACK